MDRVRYLVLQYATRLILRINPSHYATNSSVLCVCNLFPIRLHPPYYTSYCIADSQQRFRRCPPSFDQPYRTFQIAQIMQTATEATALNLINQVQLKNDVLGHVLRRRFASRYSVTH